MNILTLMGLASLLLIGAGALLLLTFLARRFFFHKKGFGFGITGILLVLGGILVIKAVEYMLYRYAPGF
jgi:hypothetical protein